MDPKRIVALVVGAAVMVLIFSALLVPIINDATTTQKTFTNDGFIRMTEITDESEDVTVTWAYTDPYTFNINDEAIVIPSTTTGGTNAFPYTIFANEGWGLRVAVSSNDRVDLNLYGSGDTSSLLWFATVTDSDTVTITFSQGTATFVKGTSTGVTQTYTSVYIPDNEGEYVLKKPNESAYMTGDSLIYSTGRTSTAFGANTFALNFNLDGNIDDGVTVTTLAPTGFTTSNVEVNADEVSGYVGLYSFDNVTFDITQTSTSITTGAVYSQVIVPYEVTVELAVHPDAPTLSLLSVIPIIAMIGIVLAVVGVAIVGRYD